MRRLESLRRGSNAGRGRIGDFDESPANCATFIATRPKGDAAK